MKLPKQLLTTRLCISLIVLLTATTLCSCGDDAENTPEPTPPTPTQKYDVFYNRPTYFPDWSQPHDWANNMVMVCQVYQGDRRLSNYEVAVYDQDNQLRHCNRSVADQDDCAVLTIMGTEGHKFHFKVIYGNDFANPVIADVPDITVDFETNKLIGLDEPFKLNILK